MKMFRFLLKKKIIHHAKNQEDLKQNEKKNRKPTDANTKMNC